MRVRIASPRSRSIRSRIVRRGRPAMVPAMRDTARQKAERPRTVRSVTVTPAIEWRAPRNCMNSGSSIENVDARGRADDGGPASSRTIRDHMDQRLHIYPDGHAPLGEYSPGDRGRAAQRPDDAPGPRDRGPRPTDRRRHRPGRAGARRGAEHHRRPRRGRRGRGDDPSTHAGAGEDRGNGRARLAQAARVHAEGQSLPDALAADGGDAATIRRLTRVMARIERTAVLASLGPRLLSVLIELGMKAASRAALVKGRPT